MIDVSYHYYVFNLNFVALMSYLYYHLYPTQGLICLTFPLVYKKQTGSIITGVIPSSPRPDALLGPDSGTLT